MDGWKKINLAASRAKLKLDVWIIYFVFANIFGNVPKFLIFNKFSSRF